MKKAVLILLALILIVVTFASCSGIMKNSGVLPSDNSQAQITQDENEHSEYSDEDFRVKFPCSVYYTDYISPTFDKKYNYAFVDVNESYLTIMPYESSEMITDTDEINDQVSKYDRQPIYLDAEAFYEDIESVSTYYNEGNELMITNQGYYLTIITDGGMNKQYEVIAKWSSSGEYQGLYNSYWCKFFSEYTYCGDYSLQGVMSKSNDGFPGHLRYTNFTDNEADGIDIDLSELENEFNISFEDEGFNSLEGEVFTEVIDVDEDGVVLSVTNRTHNGVKTVVGKASLTSRRFEVIETISYNI